MNSIRHNYFCKKNTSCAFLVAMLFYCAYGNAENISNKEWYFLDSTGSNVITQLDVKGIKRTTSTIDYSIRIKAKNKYYMKGVGEFDEIIKYYSLNCSAAYILKKYKLKNGSKFIYKQNITEYIVPQGVEDVRVLLCQRGFDKNLMMSEEDTLRELGEVK